jgi:hypothetical protein
MKIVSRKEAIANGLIKYFTGKPCKHGHTAERYTKSGCCVECLNMHNKNNYKKYAETFNAGAKKWIANNRERYREYQKHYHRAYRKRIKEQMEKKQ